MCISDEMRTGSIIIFHVSKLWKPKFLILCGVTIPGEAPGESWYWSLLGVKGLNIYNDTLHTSKYYDDTV